MKYKWLNNTNGKKLIIFFNGWGMDENVVKHLDCEDYDVLMFYDYNTLDTDFNFESLNIYHEKNLIAWSMGVIVSSLVQPLTRHFVTPSPARGEGITIAINGTLKPIDVEYGIHPRIYDLTIKGFDEKGREKFINSMFDIQPPPIPSPLEREIEEQRSELIALKEICKLTPTLTLPLEEGKTLYNKVLISDNDKIIPTKSQIAFWGIEPNLKSGHCPFFDFTKWSELL
jgi:biotin synthesis protein BioG